MSSNKLMKYLIIIALLLIPAPLSGQPEPGGIYTLRCLTEYPEQRDLHRWILMKMRKHGPNYPTYWDGEQLVIDNRIKRKRPERGK